MNTRIRTHAGVVFDPANCKVGDICITDIARGLATKCRYNGQVKQFYSVALHSVLVYNILKDNVKEDPDMWFAGLMHDASQAYLPDIPSPYKIGLNTVTMEEIQKKILSVIRDRFYMKYTLYPVQSVVKKADNTAAYIEYPIITTGKAEDLSIDKNTLYPMSSKYTTFIEKESNGKYQEYLFLECIIRALDEVRHVWTGEIS